MHVYGDYNMSLSLISSNSLIINYNVEVTVKYEIQIHKAQFQILQQLRTIADCNV